MSYFAPSASLARARARVQHGVADLVRARLPRVDAIPFHLARGETFGLADLVDEVLDRFFARPFELMQPGVDDAAIGAEQLFLQIADAAQRVVVIHAHLIGQLLGIERPAFGVTRKSDGFAQQGQVLVGERQPAFELMPRQAFVEDDGGQHEFRPFVAVAQIEIDDAGARTVERRRLRIGRGRARLQCGGHAADFELIRRQALEIRRQLLADGRELRVAIGDGLGLARVGVGKEIRGVVVQRRHASADRAFGLAQAAQQTVDARRRSRRPAPARACAPRPASCWWWSRRAAPRHRTPRPAAASTRPHRASPWRALPWSRRSDGPARGRSSRRRCAWRRPHSASGKPFSLARFASEVTTSASSGLVRSAVICFSAVSRMKSGGDHAQTPASCFMRSVLSRICLAKALSRER